MIANEGYAFIFDDFTPLNKNVAASIAHRNASSLNIGPLRTSSTNLLAGTSITYYQIIENIYVITFRTDRYKHECKYSL